MKPQSLIRPLVRALHPYVPGEQPRVKGLIKLNTNENPHPPSPRVLATVKAAVDGRLRLYPHPTAERLRHKLARLHGCRPENIIAGNGSDELLALATRAFVEPQHRGRKSSRSRVQYFTPSYSLYPVLADIHGAAKNAVELPPDFSLPPVSALRRGRQWDFNAALTYITTPNAPGGRGYRRDEMEALVRAMRGVVVLDEAYVDFARENAMTLALKHPHVLVSRTFSKAYSLCFQRIGYFVGHPDLIAALHRIRDSYNVNGLGQLAAEATLEDLGYYRRNFKRIVSVREHTAGQLAKLGWDVLPSQTNFILARPPRFPAQQWLAALRERKILVRWFSAPEVREYLRVTIGTRAEMAQFLRAVRQILRQGREVDGRAPATCPRCRPTTPSRPTPSRPSSARSTGRGQLRRGLAAGVHAGLREHQASAAQGAAGLHLGQDHLRQPHQAEGNARGARPIQAAGDLRQPRTSSGRSRQFAPHAGVVLRLRVPNTGSVVELSSKFGCDPGEAVDLIEEAFPAGPGGGRAQLPRRQPVHQLRELRPGAEPGGGGDAGSRAARAHEIKILDIGGGFPAPYHRTSAHSRLARKINAEIDRLFPRTSRSWPSRAGSWWPRPRRPWPAIIGKAVRDGKTCYYIDDGVYHTFSGIIFDHCQYHLKAFKEGPDRDLRRVRPDLRRPGHHLARRGTARARDRRPGLCREHRRLQQRLRHLVQRLPARQGCM
jgi:histidinol-phosphate aminotransferase